MCKPFAAAQWELCGSSILCSPDERVQMLLSSADIGSHARHKLTTRQRVTVGTPGTIATLC